MSRVRLLDFPPPIRGAFALSNDTDDLWDPRGWWEFLRFLNTEDDTRLGKGLGLEVGDSFWMYSDHEGEQPGSYFEGVSERRSAFAPLIDALGRAGYLDTLHSWGNFSRYGGFRRDYAGRGARALADAGFSPRVWVNHGGAHDFQNLWTGCGDLTENPEARGALCPEYHWDLTRGMGVRYLWLGELTRLPGQERRLGPRDCLHPESPLRREVMGAAARGISRRLAYRELLLQAPNYATRRNRLLDERTLRDGSVAATFVRMGDFDRATFTDLPWLLRPYVLDTLERTGGCSVAFLHWSRHPGRSFENPDPAALAALGELARRVQGGTLWVTTTGRLLAYVEARRVLRWTEREDAGALRLDLNAAPLPGGRDLDPADLAGLAFRVPDPSRTTLFWKGSRLLAETLAGHPGILWIPRRPLTFPESPPDGAR
jgi:hypothetical protein